MRISISRAKLFKACRRAYELKYIEGVYPVKDAESLVVGKNFHQKIEELYKNGSFEIEPTKESAMAVAFQKYVYPYLKVVETEKWLEKKLSEDTIVGIVDGITDDGAIAEYKTTSSANLDEYEYDLAWDEQILAYMYMTGENIVQYVIIRKPNIRIRKSETEEEFYERMVAWYDEDTRNKIRIVNIMRTDEEIEQFGADIVQLISEMKSAEQNSSFYKNTSYCWKWGRRCEYAQICLHYERDAFYAEYERREVNGNQKN